MSTRTPVVTLGPVRMSRFDQPYVDPTPLAFYLDAVRHCRTVGIPLARIQRGRSKEAPWVVR